MDRRRASPEILAAAVEAKATADALSTAIMAHIEADMLAFRTIQASIDEHNGDIKELLKVLNTARGGWRVLMIVGSIVVAVGAVIGFVLKYFVLAH